ncbi:MAG: GHKL domain-containing protein [Holophagaceae bacterium]|nr:GHKL domain-containing protein [Holophagaceae bacterium]
MTGQEGTLSHLTPGLINLLLPVLIWVALARLRSPVVALWCLGSLLGAGSLLLDGFTGSLPDWVGFPGANLLAFAGLLCTVQALRQDRGVPWRLRWLVVASLGYLLVHELLRLGLGQVPLRLGFVALTNLILLLQVAGWAWRIARRPKSPGALTMAVAYLFLAGGLVHFLLELVLAGGGVPTRLGALAIGINSAGVLADLAGDVGFLGVALERSVHHWQKAAASQARLEEHLRLGNQVAQLERQRSLGLMAGSLAHELNQPLTAILASAQAVRRSAAAKRLGSVQSLELLDKVIFNTRRITGITERIRGFIRPGGLDSAPVDLELITRDMLELMQPELRRHGIRVVFQAVGEPVLVQGDAIQLSQVVLNALRNALEAMQLVPDRSLQIMLTRSAGEAVLCLRDSGPGLDPALADQVGTPYFTTKEQGLGLGLSISTAILRHHQGSLTLRNAEEGGACVDIRLPLLAGGVP